jgi:hypothetical protein
MATSGSYDFTVTRDQLIELSHQHIGALGEGESCTTAQITEAARLLNMLVKLRAADGMPLWALKRGTILPVTGVSSVNSDSHVVTSYDYTTLSAAAASSDASIVVTSATGIALSDVIGVEITGGMHWTTVSSVSGTTIGLTVALTAAAAEDAAVYTYTTTDRVQKPIRVIEANIKDSEAGTSWSIEVEDQSDYYSLGNRTSTGIPNLVYFDVQSTSSTNLDNGTFYIYPRFTNGEHVIEFTYHRPFQDFDSSSDNPDFPQAFYLPLMLELAALIGPKFGVTIEERNALRGEAKLYRDEALSTVQPEGSITFEKEYQ